MANISYDNMNLLYRFEPESPADLCRFLSLQIRKRRLERGLSREALSMMSGIPVPTIAKFETKNSISLQSFVAICQSLGYTGELKAILERPKYKTMEELEIINKNKYRKKGRNEFTK